MTSDDYWLIKIKSLQFDVSTKMFYKALILFGVLETSSAFWFIGSGPDWNDLKVKWGINPFTSFNTMPKTVANAVSDGFKQISGCDASPTAKFRGARYVKNGDGTISLLFDKNGYIAGIQIVFPSGQPKNYPAKLIPPFVEINGSFYLTAYFVQPDTICKTGRTADEFEDQGTGTELLIQNGTDPDNSLVSIPKLEKDLKGTNWVKGKCFYTMGMHYWYEASKDSDCEAFFPVFLLYNKGKLNAFGWVVGAHLTSPNMEHAPVDAIKNFFVETPQCIYNGATFATQHIYLTSTPRLNWC